MSFALLVSPIALEQKKCFKKKGLVLYFNNNEIIALRKHVDENHGLIEKKKIEEKCEQHEKSNEKITYKEKAFNQCECNL